MRGQLAPCRAGDDTHYVLNAQLGSEYDSNVHRTELVAGALNPGLVASPAARAVVSGSLSDAIANGQSVSVSAMGAGKLFADAAARSEDLAVAQTTGSWRLAWGERASIGLQAVYYEAFQRSSGDPNLITDRRDFRSIAPGARWTYALGQRGELAVGAGYRIFVLKPDLYYDFNAPTGSIDLRWARESGDGGADWELGAGGSVELRAFEGDALKAPAQPPQDCGPTTTNSGCLPTVGSARRSDTLLIGHLELARTGKVLLGAGYALQWNSSNSFGETVTRHFLTLRLAAPLPLGLYLAARGELLVATYRDPVFIGQLDASTLTYVSIEDENRSSLRVDLSRALGDRLQLLARYTLYVNELGVSGPAVSYRRQTVLLSLGFTIDK